MISEGNGPKIGLKISCLILITLMIGIGLAAFVPVVEESDGWESYDQRGAYNSNGDTGFCYFYSNSNPRAYYKSYTSTSPVGNYYNSYSHYYTYYRGWIGFPVSGLDEMTYVNSITLDLNTNSYWAEDGSPEFYIYVYLLDQNPYMYNGVSCWNAISSGSYIGNFYCTGTGTTSFSITGSNLNNIREKISDGDDHIYFGFYDGGSAYREYTHIYSSNSYLRMNIDRSAPTVPLMEPLEKFNPSTSIQTLYNSYDLPLNGNSSDVEYQTGLFDNDTAEDPFMTYEWTSYENKNLTGLNDGQQYFIRTKARDANEFTSGWSDCINTTIDVSPPSTPVLEPETEYSEGTSLTVDWSESTDAGIGLDTYELHRSTDPTFSTFDEMMFGPGNSSYTYDDCVNGVKYYFRMKANDTFDQWSDLCPTVSTTMDDEAPTVPVMMTEPIFTKGLDNTFQWHPAVDNGIGLDHYQIQLSYSEDFLPHEIQEDITTDQTLTTFTDLNDGDSYYVRVRSIDEFDHISEWSSIESSVQDDTGPGEPGLISLMEYQMDGAVQLEWEGSIDDGVGVGWYMVEWSEDMNFIEEVMVKDHILGQSMTILDLATDVPYYFRVTAFDTLGTMGAMDTTSTTLDSSPPELPIITEMDEFTFGTRKMVTWSASTDAVSGIDHYLLEVFTDENATIKTFEIHTTDTEFEVPGLSGGQIYYYRITAFDVAGNSIVSGLRFSTQDTMAPVIGLDKGDLFGSNDPNIEGSIIDDISGIASVEISSNEGGTWDGCPLSSDAWTYSMSNIPPGTTMVWVRSTDIVGNIGEPVIVNIDNVAPIIEVTSPSAGKKITGPAQITGRIIDPHLASYSVDYRLSGTEAWNSIVPEQFTSDFSGVMGTWLPAGLPDGDYLIKVTATDSLEQSSEIVFNLTLEQASISIGPSSITFSDVDPLLGETVTISVMVSNLGGSDAEDVTVTIYDNGEEIKTVTDQTVPSMGVIYVEVVLPVTAYHNITARATSDRYDTGEMTTASKLVAEIPEPEEKTPEESFLEDSAGILGLLALIIGILAIIIAIILGVLLSRRKPVEAKEAEVKEAEGPPGMPAAPDVPTLPEAGATAQELPSTQPPQTSRPSLPPLQGPPQHAPTPAPVPAPVQEPAPAPAEPQFQAPPSVAPVQRVEAPMQAAPQPNVQLPKQ